MMRLTVPVLGALVEALIPMIEADWSAQVESGKTTLLFEAWTYPEAVPHLLRSGEWTRYLDQADWLVSPQALAAALQDELPNGFTLVLEPYSDGRVVHQYRLSYVGRVGGAA